MLYNLGLSLITLVNRFILVINCKLRKNLCLKSKLALEISKACTFHGGCQNKVDEFVLKSVVGRTSKITILDAMSLILE